MPDKRSNWHNRCTAVESLQMGISSQQRIVGSYDNANQNILLPLQTQYYPQSENDILFASYLGHLQTAASKVQKTTHLILLALIEAWTARQSLLCGRV